MSKSKKKNQDKPKRVKDPKTGKLLFAEGNSGGGRPKGSVSVVSAIKRKLKEKVGDEDQRTNLEALVDKIISKALHDGDTKIITDLIDRVDGKAKEHLDLTSGNKPIPILANVQPDKITEEDNGSGEED